MTTFNRINNATTAVLCVGLIGATICAWAPSADARSYDVERQQELRQLRRDIQRDARENRRARRAYEREINRYPQVMPVYEGPAYPRVLPAFGAPAGFGIQLGGFGIEFGD